MQIVAKTPNEYLSKIPEERHSVFNKLRNTILENLPHGFEEVMNYGMIGYVVPHSLYPKGYHVNPKDPLPFINIASQKNFIALYHLGIYADSDLLNWFITAYPNHAKTKLDMGKSCIRFKKMNDIPFDLLAELFRKISPDDWIKNYESALPKK